MKLINFDIKKGTAKFRVTSPEDFWHLHLIIDSGDKLTGKAYRKIKKSGAEERTGQITRIPMTITIQIEKSDLSSDFSSMRVLGTITQGPDHIPLGSYQSISIEQDQEYILSKLRWLSFQKKKLEEASKEKKNPLLLVVFDREEAFIAKSHAHDYTILAHLEGQVAKKASSEVIKTNFYKELQKEIKEYSDRLGSQHILIASPAFWKDEFFKECSDKELTSKMIHATISSVSKQAFTELLKRPEVKQALQEERMALELTLVDELFREISKDKLTVYGTAQVGKAAELGAIKELFITTECIFKARESESFSHLDTIMRQVDATKGTIHLISSHHEGGQKLDGIGGIAAILRYKI